MKKHPKHNNRSLITYKNDKAQEKKNKKQHAKYFKFGKYN